MQLQKTLFLVVLTLFMACSKESASEESLESKDLKQLVAQKILLKTNTIRESQGLEEVIQDDEMDALATLHSENMITHEFFDHIDHQGKAPADRADDLNYSWSSIAENIAFVPWFENVGGCGDTRTAESLAECVVEGWKNSPGHYTNMIGDYKELGVGVAFTQDSIAYFTQVFRTR
jgi:uncharacterized protein YkwD